MPSLEADRGFHSAYAIMLVAILLITPCHAMISRCFYAEMFAFFFSYAIAADAIYYLMTLSLFRLRCRRDYAEPSFFFDDAAMPFRCHTLRFFMIMISHDFRRRYLPHEMPAIMLTPFFYVRSRAADYDDADATRHAYFRRRLMPLMLLFCR